MVMLVVLFQLVVVVIVLHDAPGHPAPYRGAWCTPSRPPRLRPSPPRRRGSPRRVQCQAQLSRRPVGSPPPAPEHRPPRSRPRSPSAQHSPEPAPAQTRTSESPATAPAVPWLEPPSLAEPGQAATRRWERTPGVSSAPGWATPLGSGKHPQLPLVVGCGHEQRSIRRCRPKEPRW